jgi:hypothetical protein
MKKDKLIKLGNLRAELALRRLKGYCLTDEEKAVLEAIDQELEAMIDLKLEDGEVPPPK